MKSPQFKPYTLPDGRAMHCVVCTHDRFELRTFHLVDRVPIKFMNWVWPFVGSRAAQAAVCEKCGYVHLFFQE
jgi:C4-type Zn-finger protein